jgi:hypothetical protein
MTLPLRQHDAPFLFDAPFAPQRASRRARSKRTRSFPYAAGVSRARSSSGVASRARLLYKRISRFVTIPHGTERRTDTDRVMHRASSTRRTTMHRTSRDHCSRDRVSGCATDGSVIERAADESTCKPDSVSGACAPDDGHPSGPAVADRFLRSTRRLGRAALERLREPELVRLFLTLLRVGFTEPLRSPGTLVVSYTAVSPLPTLARRRSGFCGTVPRVAPGCCWQPPCPVESGLSSARSADRVAAVRSARPPRGRWYADADGIGSMHA